MDKEFKRQTIEILENFDFSKIHDVMTFLNWKYAFSPIDDHVPTVQQLKFHAEAMLDFVSSNYTKHMTSGGFCVQKLITQKESRLKLSFELDSRMATSNV